MTRLYAVFSSHALLPFPFRGSSLSARISEVRRRFSNNLHNFCCAQFLPPMRRTGAMLVAICMPCGKSRWLFFAFGVLADGHTYVFRHPFCKQRSERLFLLIPRDEAASDHQTRISVSIASHAALWTENQGSPWSIATGWHPLSIPSHQAIATSTFSARIARIDSAGDDPRVPCLVLGIREDASLHPV